MSLLEEERIIKAYERSILGEGKKKDCPDGHEWDEKLQECLPSSTGIKEDDVDEKKKECPDGHEWDEKLQECLPSSTGIKEDDLDERLGEKGRTKEGMIEKRGTEKVKKAAGYLEIAIKLLADARKFEIYTKEGMKASKDEIQTLTSMKKELEARVESLK